MPTQACVRLACPSCTRAGTSTTASSCTTATSGNFGGWKAQAIGSNNQAAKSILKTDYADGMSVEDALKLSVKVLGKTMDTTTPSAEKMEFTVL